MKTETLELFSEGTPLVGLLRTPEATASDPPWPVIVQPPGYLGLAGGPVSEMYHAKFTDAGFCVVSVDYRGFGASEGAKGWIHPARQLEDLVAVMDYVAGADPRLDPARVFCYGHGGTGGGNAILLGAIDDRVRAVAAQTPVADGEQWLRRMRSEADWQAYLRRLKEDAVVCATDGVGELVNPREEIMVATPERRREATRSYADDRIPDPFHLASASLIMRYRPVDWVKLISPRPLLLISLSGDVVTPPDIGAEALYKAAGLPKRIVRQRGELSHYDAYRVNLDVICEEIVSWFRGAASAVEPVFGEEQL